VAARVELNELRYGGHLAHQPLPVETPVLKQGLGPWQLGDSADLILDLLDEMPNFERRGFSLIALHVSERALVLVIREPDFEWARTDQPHEDHGDEQADIFANNGRCMTVATGSIALSLAGSIIR
jgi:hypothetical protein